MGCFLFSLLTMRVVSMSNLFTFQTVSSYNGLSRNAVVEESRSLEVEIRDSWIFVIARKIIYRTARNISISSMFRKPNEFHDEV